MFGLLKCLIGKHHRSKARAVPDIGTSYRSVCVRCGRAMRQDHRRNWVIDKRLPEDRPERERVR